jgi:hypothetical protein
MQLLKAYFRNGSPGVKNKELKLFQIMKSDDLQETLTIPVPCS